MHIDIYKDKKNQFRWRAVSVNGNVLADSGESYRNRADLVTALQVLGKFFPDQSRQAIMRLNEGRE